MLMRACFTMTAPGWRRVPALVWPSSTGALRDNRDALERRRLATTSLSRLPRRSPRPVKSAGFYVSARMAKICGAASSARA